MALLNIYLGVMVVMMLVAGFMFIEGSFKEKKIASRMIIFAPIWPTLAPVFLIIGFRYFWKTADWRGVREEEEEERLQRVRSRW